MSALEYSEAISAAEDEVNQAGDTLEVCVTPFSGS